MFEKILTGIMLALIVAALATVGTLVIVKRMRTGDWGVPTRGDYVWVKSQMKRGKQPPRVVYLNSNPTTLSKGTEASYENSSGIIKVQSAKLPGFKGKKAAWRSIVKCVTKMFDPYDITITEQRPNGPGYIMAMVGGRPKDIGLQDGHHVGGLAPFNGDIIRDATVFAFSKELGNRPQAVCETLAMEIAHAYGLDHSFLCKDVMTYRTGCGKKSFVDKDAPCGEHEARECADGKPTQNSHRQLVQLLGERVGTAASR
jgi:hypothetical protein